MLYQRNRYILTVLLLIVPLAAVSSQQNKPDESSALIAEARVLWE